VDVRGEVESITHFRRKAAIFSIFGGEKLSLLHLNQEACVELSFDKCFSHFIPKLDQSIKILARTST
jgi:hypothetical protein